MLLHHLVNWGLSYCSSKVPFVSCAMNHFMECRCFYLFVYLFIVGISHFAKITKRWRRRSLYVTVRGREKTVRRRAKRRQEREAKEGNAKERKKGRQRVRLIGSEPSAHLNATHPSFCLPFSHVHTCQTNKDKNCNSIDNDWQMRQMLICIYT